MKTVSMLEFRKRAEAILRQVRQGKGFLLTYRGKPVARLEPVEQGGEVPADDPFYRMAEIASDTGPSLTNAEIDQILYGQ